MDRNIEGNENSFNINTEGTDDAAMANEGLSRRSRIVKELVAEFNHNTYLKSHFIGNKRSVSEFDKPFRYPEHIAVRRIAMANFNMELISWKDSDNPWVILHLHGGGYMNAFKNNYRSMAGLYSEVAKGAAVLTIDYRVAPENPFPAALFDARDAYDWLLANGYDEEHIVLAGDSAGGGLALCLCHYLRDCEKKLPAGIVCMSPWTDLTASGQSYRDKFEEDPVFGNTDDSIIYDNPYIGDEDPENPYISPLFGEYEGFPPILIQVGTSEMLLSDSQQLAAKAKAAGVKVRLSEYEGMFHVFQMCGKLMEESGRAWVEIGRFLAILRGEDEL